MSALPSAHVWPLEHWMSMTGRVMLREGPRATSVNRGDLDALLHRARNGVTGIVRRRSVTLDESQITHLLDTYFPDEPRRIEPDTAFCHDDVPVSEWMDWHGFDRTPGQWPSPIAGI